MATREMPILGPFTAVDNSARVYFETLQEAMTLSTATLGNTMTVTIEAPAVSDIGVLGSFTVPQDYVGSPVLVIRGYLGEAANVLAFGFQQQGGLADSDSLDIAYEPEDTASNSNWTGYAVNDLFEITITITPSSPYVAGDVVNFFFYRDNSVDTQTGEFHLAGDGLYLQYSDA